MPYKSKRNRRMSQKRRTGANPAIDRPIPNIQPATAQPEKAVPSYSKLKTTPVGVTSFPNFFKDLRWIGIVTVIVLILLVAAYYIFH